MAQCMRPKASSWHSSAVGRTPDIHWGASRFERPPEIRQRPACLRSDTPQLKSRLRRDDRDGSNGFSAGGHRYTDSTQKSLLTAHTQAFPGAPPCQLGRRPRTVHTSLTLQHTEAHKCLWWLGRVLPVWYSLASSCYSPRSPGRVYFPAEPI
jgi:hypothetical protein